MERCPAQQLKSAQGGGGSKVLRKKMDYQIKKYYCYFEGLKMLLIKYFNLFMFIKSNTLSGRIGKVVASHAEVARSIPG